MPLEPLGHLKRKKGLLIFNMADHAYNAGIARERGSCAICRVQKNIPRLHKYTSTGHHYLPDYTIKLCDKHLVEFFKMFSKEEVDHPNDGLSVYPGLERHEMSK